MFVAGCIILGAGGFLSLALLLARPPKCPYCKTRMKDKTLHTNGDDYDYWVQCPNENCRWEKKGYYMYL